MGLDNYAVYGKDHPKYNHTEGASNGIPDELFPNNHLCGGLFSGGGNSFRGKVYNGVVEFFTNHTLYEDVLDPSDVQDIYDSLSKVTEKRFRTEFSNQGYNNWDITYEEVKDLTKWFGVVVSEGGCVISWY